jgi:hypothetical protein
MLFSVVDDRSGVAYQEYHCAYGAAAAVALQFLFNASSYVKRDRFGSVRYPERLNSSKSSFSLQRPDRYEILVQKRSPFQLDS